MSRSIYQHAYYLRTKARRRLLASRREQVKRWAQWLLDELHSAGVLTGSYSVEQPHSLNLRRARSDALLVHGHGINTADGRHRHRHPEPVRARLRAGLCRLARIISAPLRDLEWVACAQKLRDYYVAPFIVEQLL